MHPAILLINVYQRYLSPHKGFCCAYRVAMGEPSCSEFAKLAIRKKGFFSALSDIRGRMGDCQSAALMLSKQREDKVGQKRKKKADTSADCVKDACGDCALQGACNLSSGVGKKGSMLEGCGDACSCNPF